MKIEIIKGDNNPVADFFSSPSNTPETDAAIYPMTGVDIVWPEFARKLERERDEAREKAERYRLEANSLMLQRDEARGELHDIRLNLGEDAEGYTLLHAVCAIQNGRDEAREVLSKIDEIFCDGEDTHDDWMKIGIIAKDYLKGLE